MNETINDRIEMLINERFEGNKAAFAKSIGMAPTAISSYLGKQRRSKPSIDMVTKIIQVLEVDARWLLLGEKSANGHTIQTIGNNSPAAINGNATSCSGQSETMEMLVAEMKSRLEDKDKIIKLLEERLKE